MAETVRDVMTPDPMCLPTTSPVIDAARAMRDADVGTVIVLQGETITGILTDRDIVVRGVAESLDPQRTTIGDVCSRELTSIAPDDDLDRAITMMREKAIRRLPVVEKGRPVGILSLGDLALERDERSLLGQISAAVPNR